MKTKTLTLFAFLFLCFLFCSWGQENKLSKEHDSLLKIYHKTPDGLKKIKLLGKLCKSVAWIDVELANKYAWQTLKMALKFDETKEIGWAYYNIASIYKNKGQKDSIPYYINKAKEIFTKKGVLKGEAMANDFIAILAREKGDFDTALEINKKNIQIVTALKDTAFLAAVYLNISHVHLDKGNYNIAYEYGLKSLKQSESINSPLDTADALLHVAGIDSHLNNIEKAISYKLRALKIYEQRNDKVYQSLTLSNLGASYIFIEEYAMAEKYLLKGLSIAKKMENNRYEGLITKNLGDTYMYLNKPDQALPMLKKAISLGKHNGYYLDVVQAQISISKLYYRTNSFTIALQNTNRLIKLCDSLEIPRQQLEAIELKSKIHKKQKKFDLALVEYTRFKILNDSLFDLKKDGQIEELKTIYETEKKEQQLALQEKEITVLEQEAKIGNQQRWLLGGGMTLSILALGFGFYGFRQKTKRNGLEKEKIEAELAFKKKELTTHALHLAKKNEVLEHVKLKAKDLKSQGDAKGYQELIKTINFDQQDDKNWESFTQYFEQVHKDFAKNVKNRYPEVTKNELRFMALLKMNLSSKEIATILNISADGVKKARQRLRKKMSLLPEDSLETTVMTL